MAVNVRNVGEMQVAIPTFVAEAIKAGIAATIRSLVPLATDRRQLLLDLKAALEQSNKPLADALNFQTLEAILRYMELTGQGIVLGSNIPDLLDADGPEAIWPAYYPETDILAIGWQDADADTYAQYWVSLDQAVIGRGLVPETGVNIEVPVVDLAAGTHVVSVCWVDAEGNITRLASAELTVS
jgi:hypothetical protein